MKLYGEVQDGKRNKWLSVGGDPDHHAGCLIGNPTITQQIYERIFKVKNFKIALQWYTEQLINFFGVILITMLTLQIVNQRNDLPW